MMSDEQRPAITPSIEQGYAIIRDFARTCPQKSGCYCMHSQQDELLYVGKAKNLRKRLLSYCSHKRNTQRIQRMIAQIHKITITITDTDTEALLLESNFIKKQNPRYNILLKDDKSMPCLFIRDNHDFPRMEKHRGVQTQTGEYFGPFASTHAVNQALISLQKIFQLRDCSDTVFKRHQNQPCMRYQIKRCSAPCSGYIDKKNYQDSVNNLKGFLAGKHDEVRQQIQQQMQDLSDNMEYERALSKREQLKQLAKITAFQKINLPDIQDMDVIALFQQAGQSCAALFFYRGGCLFGHRSYFPKHSHDASPEEIMASLLGQIYSINIPPPIVMMNALPDSDELLYDALAARRQGKIEFLFPMRGARKKVIEHALANAKQSLMSKISTQSSWKQSLSLLQKRLNLPHTPKRIEIYDNSHMQGSHPVSAMVVAGQEGLIRAAYRKFYSKSSTNNDDYAMMDEVMHRRFTRYQRQEKNWGMHPDLLLIDGGKGQVSTVKHVIDRMQIDNVTILGIAKGPDRNAGNEQFITQEGEIFQLEKNDPLLFFLQNLRDEAHRYALGSHVKKRHKQNLQNPLDEILGIGHKRRRQLLLHFGSAKSVADASLEDLQNVEGISRAMAQKVYQHFHE